MGLDDCFLNTQPLASAPISGQWQYGSPHFTVGLLEESGVGYGGEGEELTHGSVSIGLMLCLLQKLLDARLTDRRGVPA